MTGREPGQPQTGAYIAEHRGYAQVVGEENKLLREQLDAATVGIDLAIGMQEALRMDTPEDEAIRLRGLETLRLARAALGVVGTK